MISVGHYLAVSAVLFTLGVLGIFINRKNIIVILMAIELILLAVNINLVAFSAFLGDLTGQIFAMFVLTVAAGEAAIKSAHPLGRWAEPKEIADAIFYLSGPAASFVTGQILMADGGYSAR